MLQVSLAVLIALACVRLNPSLAAPGELDELQTFAIDPALPPDQLLAARPFVVPGERCPVFCIDDQAIEEPLGETAARARLSRFLIARGASAKTQDEALARYDADATAEIIADPTLRASLLLLSGWHPYDAVIAAVLDGENESGLPFADVSFQEFGNISIAFLGGTSDGLFALRVNRDFAAEAPETLANVLIHETLHDPYVNSFEEEVIANILDGVSYAEILLVRPDLAASGTTLTVYNNFSLLALLNSSGSAGPARLGISTARFGDVWLGDELGESDAASLRDAIAGDNIYASLPRGGSRGNPALAALLDRFPDAAGLGPAPRFDEAALDVIDGGIGSVLAPDDALALAQTLGLALAGPVAEVPADAIGPRPSDPNDLLASRPFVPTNVALFDPTLAAARAVFPRSDRSTRDALSVILDAIEMTPELGAAVLDRYDDLDQRIPSPSLRAAAALLLAMPAGEPIADSLLGSTRDSRLDPGDGVAMFAPMPHGTPYAIVSTGVGTYRVEINDQLAGESLALLASTLLEAALMTPLEPTGHATEDQRVLAHALATVVYADFVIATPDLVRVESWLASERNRALLALLNSTSVRDNDDVDSPNGSIGLLDPAAGVADVLPNLYADARSYEADVLTRPGATDLAPTRRQPASPLAVAVFAALGLEASPAEANRPPTFGDLLATLDARLGVILPPDSVERLAGALELGVRTRSDR